MKNADFPASPVLSSSEFVDADQAIAEFPQMIGLTKREYAAIEAMKGLCSDNQTISNAVEEFGAEAMPAHVAIVALGLADALLSALEES